MMMKVHCDDQPAPSMNPIQNKQAPRMAFSATQGLGAKTQGGKTKAPLPKNKASLVKNSDDGDILHVASKPKSSENWVQRLAS